MKEKYTWDLTDFFLSEEAFIQELNKLQVELEELDTTISQELLEEQLKKYYELLLVKERLYVYSELSSDLDMANQKYIQYKNQIALETKKLEKIKERINQEILKIDVNLEEYMKDHPSAKQYNMHFYEVLRLKPHIVSSPVVANEESFLSNVNDLYRTILNVERENPKVMIEEEEIIVNATNLNKFLLSDQQEIRKTIFLSYLKGLGKVNKSISNLYYMRFKLCYDIAREKGFSSILEQNIIEDDLNLTLIDNLLKAVHDHLPLLAKYLTLKKRKLNVEELHFYDMKKSSEFTKKIKFQEGVDLVVDSLNVLGSSYKEKLEQVLEGGFLDVFPKKHKVGGGYHFRNYTKPMILMNYHDEYQEVFTIAHELGHAVNGLFVKEHHKFQDFHFSSFLSEVASLTNEMIFEEYTKKHASSLEEEIYIVEQKIDKFISNVFLSTLYLEFQKETCSYIEKNQAINNDLINNTFASLFQKYYQGMTFDEEMKYYWETRIHHFYEKQKYYNFQYATGFIAAIVLSKKVLTKEGLAKYLEFLTIGGSKPTLETLKVAGIDVEDLEVYNHAMNYFADLLKEYEVLLAKSRDESLKSQ